MAYQQNTAIQKEQSSPLSSFGLTKGSISKPRDPSVKPKDDSNIDTSNRWAPLLKHANELGQSRLLENKKSRQRQWTPEKRAKQRQIINDNKPWRKSTGAKTARGKRNSSQNALKHGGHSQSFADLKAKLKEMEAIRRAIHKQTWEKIRVFHEIRAKTRLMSKPTLTILTKQTHAFIKESGLRVDYHEVKRMIKEATGLTETDYITAPDQEIFDDQLSLLKKIVDRRIKGEPLSRIMGEREFWGLNFKVTPDVLDPRPDTETLVEAVLAFLKEPQAGKPATADQIPSLACGHGDKQIKILDLGTGTGCIPISLLTELPNATAYAVEYSESAARIARENAIKNGVSDRFHIIQGDWMGALKPQTFDIITSNPPYIIESDIENLDVEVKNHDPILALSGGVDGLDDYKKIISYLKTHLKKDAAAFLEIGFGQLDDLKRLVGESRLVLCDSVADIQGIPRVVEIRANSINGDK